MNSLKFSQVKMALHVDGWGFIQEHEAMALPRATNRNNNLLLNGS
jgi:hypothetical protein